MIYLNYSNSHSKWELQTSSQGIEKETEALYVFAKDEIAIAKKVLRSLNLERALSCSQ